MNGRTRRQLRTDVVEVVWQATNDRRRGGVTGQETLARLAGCSTATLSAEMPAIVELSRQLHPGHALETGLIERRGRLAVYRYRVVSQQAHEEMVVTRTRCRQAETKIRRAVNEIDVQRAGPNAQAAVDLIDAGVELLVRGLRRYELALLLESP